MDGTLKDIIIWRCGVDSFVASSLDALADPDRRVRTPEWILNQLQDLPASKQFDWRGISYAELPDRGESLESVDTSAVAEDDIEGAEPA